MMPKTILITGTAGFIGFHVARYFLKHKKDVQVIGLDNINDYYDTKLKQKRLEILKKFTTFSFYKVDITDYKKVASIVAKKVPDLIIHLAAQAGVRFSIENPWTYVDTNVRGTLNVFEVAKEYKVKRVLYASSSSVYGKTSKKKFRENDITDTPISVYAATKKATEVLAYSYGDLWNMELVGLRFFTVYGPWGRPDMAYFKFMKSILNNEEITLYNKGKMSRSFTYIDDIVDGIIKISYAKKIPERIYNLGGADSVTLSHFVNAIENALKKKASIVYGPMQPGDVKETIADYSRAKRDFNFSPKVSIEQGMNIFAKWFEENSSWLKTLKKAKQ